MDAGLEQKLRELVDRDEIHRVMVRYARGLDRLDFELVRSCYWDDAIEDHGNYVGQPDDFIRWADETTKAHHEIPLRNRWSELGARQLRHQA